MNWQNYETVLLRDYIFSDAIALGEWKERAREIADGEEFCVVAGQLADLLMNYFFDHEHILDAQGVAGKLVAYALARAEWREIADQIINVTDFAGIYDDAV